MQVHQQSKSLVLKLRNPERVTQYIPKARVVEVEGVNYTQVKFGLDEARVLRNLGIAAPSPIRYFYDWPSKYPCPMDHQVTTAEFFTLNNRGICLNDMGTAKTLSALWATDYLMRLGVIQKTVIACTRSTMSTVWLDEVRQNFLGKRKAVVLSGSRERRLKLLNEDADFYIINHDGLKVIKDELAKRTDINHWILDEAAELKNPQSERHKVFANLVKPTDWMWLLTGTPCSKEPTDVWGLAKLLGSKKIPHYFSAFRNQLMQQITQFKWVPKPGAFEMAYEVLTPSIRFKKSDCVSLPPLTFTTRMAEMSSEQKTAYENMKQHLVVEVKGVEITAAHAATKMTKLMQISCLKYTTPVMTSRGWVPICEVTERDLVWDGVEWVSQKGAAYMGDKPTVSLDGISLTADHRVLTEKGWKTAEEILNADASERLDRVEVRLPDGYSAPGVNNPREDEKGHVAVSLRLRGGSSPCESESAPNDATKRQPLRMSVGCMEQNARQVQHATLQCLGRHEAQVHRPEEQRLAQLRRAGDKCCAGVAGLCFVCSEYGIHVQTGTDIGSVGQRRSVRSVELPVGNTSAAGKQQAYVEVGRNPGRSNDGDSSGDIVRNPEGYSFSTAERGLANRKGDSTPVFDLVDCGPRNRFVVMGEQGQLVIVHNCGMVYDEYGDGYALDASPRLSIVDELVDESSNNVIIFVPFTKCLDLVAKHVRSRGYTVEVVDGRVGDTERKRIFSEFQNGEGRRVLVAHPKTAAHGLTLTRADLTIWYGPIFDLGIFEQANNRMDRPDQKNPMTIACIAANALELELYSALKNKQTMQNTILAMFKSELGLPNG